MPITALIHITSAYSNAVLVAILPHVNDFAKKLDLPIPLPITTSQVLRFNVGRMQDFVGGGLWLTNHYQFVFDDGYVDSFTRLEGNPFLSEDPAKDWPHYIGKENINTNEAIELARGALRKLGYDPKMLHADVAPYSVEGSYDLREGHFPYCQIKWTSQAETPEEMKESSSIKFQINMVDKSIMGMSIFSKKIQLPNPKIDIQPELESDYRNRIQSHTNVPVLNLNTGKPPNILRKTE
jgi:hypothetical protein